MGPSKRGVFPAIALVTLFILSVQSYMFTENTEDYSQLYESYIDSSTPIGQSTTVSIGSFPDGAVEKVSVSVPNGEVVQSLGLDIESAALPTSTAFSITKSLDFSSSQYFSGVDVQYSKDFLAFFFLYSGTDAFSKTALSFLMFFSLRDL